MQLNVFKKSIAFTCKFFVPIVVICCMLKDFLELYSTLKHRYYVLFIFDITFKDAHK